MCLLYLTTDLVVRYTQSKSVCMVNNNNNLFSEAEWI